MSILIKGMKMPETCRYCEFERIGQFGGEWCALTKTDIPRKPIKRLKDCPLVEVVMPNIVHWLNDIEIVRCKDCKYFEEIMTARFRDGTTKEVQSCKKRVPLKDENFYCGWGERKESEVYCDRNLCTLNEYNGVGCDECQEKRRGEVKE